jgi:hypothetical protein
MARSIRRICPLTIRQKEMSLSMPQLDSRKDDLHAQSKAGGSYRQNAP